MGKSLTVFCCRESQSDDCNFLKPASSIDFDGDLGSANELTLSLRDVVYVCRIGSIKIRIQVRECGKVSRWRKNTQLIRVGEQFAVDCMTEPLPCRKTVLDLDR